MCQLFFINFLFFHQMIALTKLWFFFDFFISSKKLFSFLRYLNFCVFSLPFQTFQIQKFKWKWNNLWCHELTCINLQMWFLKLLKTSLHYIIKLGQIIYSKQINFSELVSWPKEQLVTSSRPLVYFKTLPIKIDWIQKKK